MLKRAFWRSSAVLFCVAAICLPAWTQSPASANADSTQNANTADTEAPVQPAIVDLSSDAASKAALKSAQENVARVKALVEAGQRPQRDLDAAQAQLADAQDEETLAKTLYSGRAAQDMTPEESDAMLAAARNRVDRQAKLVAAEKALSRKGHLARSKLADSEAELQTRERVLGLAEDRVRQVRQLAAMANDESADGARLLPEDPTAPVIRYDGSAIFSLRELRGIERSYRNEFHERLPVSAVGQTRLHRSLGLNHRGRVDVALNPDCPEGIWLRQYLEDRHIPYLAFRCAIRGAATAPHIHIGPESTRLKLVRRSGSLRSVRALR